MSTPLSNPQFDPDLLKRITTDPRQCGGAPCVRNMRVRVSDVLSYLAGGDSEQTVAEHLAIEIADVRACLAYAVRYLPQSRLVA